MKRVAIIGHTGNGDYGHNVDIAFTGVEGADVVALADPDDAGRAARMTRSGATRGYSDYREMVAAEKPDIVVIATHEMTGHLAMVRAAAEAAAHVYMEKPLAARLGDFQEMVEVTERAGVRIVCAHPLRGKLTTARTVKALRGGLIGDVRFARVYGIAHPNAGDQWLIDLYPHLFDTLVQVLGPPLWCQSMICMDGRPATPADRFEGMFGMGTCVGNGLWAHIQFENCAAEYESFTGELPADGELLLEPMRIDFHGTAGSISIPGVLNEGPDVYQHPGSHPRLVADDRWTVLEEEQLDELREDAADPDLGLGPRAGQKWINAHHRLAAAMIDAIDGKPTEIEWCDGPAALLLHSMAMAIHASHIEGRRIAFPYAEQDNPFDTWA